MEGSCRQANVGRLCMGHRGTRGCAWSGRRAFPWWRRHLQRLHLHQRLRHFLSRTRDLQNLSGWSWMYLGRCMLKSKKDRQHRCCRLRKLDGPLEGVKSSFRREEGKIGRCRLPPRFLGRQKYGLSFFVSWQRMRHQLQLPHQRQPMLRCG